MIDTEQFKMLASIPSPTPGGGVLRGPLSAEVIQQAVDYGERFCASIEDMKQDPYTLWVPKFGMVVSLRPVFREIAAYAGICKGVGQTPEPIYIANINFDPTYAAHYGMQVLSGYKTVSCIVVGGPIRMENLVLENQAGGYAIKWAFPYPHDLGATMAYEILVPRILMFGPKERFSFNFAALR